MKISAGKLWGLRRLSDGDGYFEMIATDQRPLFARLVADKRGVDPPPYDEVAGIVTRIAAELQSEASAILLDPIYGYPSAIGHIDTSKGILHTYESLDMDRSPGGAKIGADPRVVVEKNPPHWWRRGQSPGPLPDRCFAGGAGSPGAICPASRRGVRSRTTSRSCSRPFHIRYRGRPKRIRGEARGARHRGRRGVQRASLCRRHFQAWFARFLDRSAGKGLG